MYEPGMVIAFHQNAKGYQKGDRVVVGDVVPTVVLEQANRFQVYRAGTLALAQRDKVRSTSNGKTKDGKHRVNNRSTYEFDGLTDRGDIRLSNGWILDRDFGFLAAGHVVTSFGAQGKTINGRVILAESSARVRAASREQFYVSSSRSKRSVLVVTDDKAALRDAVTRGDERMTATELVNC